MTNWTSAPVTLSRFSDCALYNISAAGKCAGIKTDRVVVAFEIGDIFLDTHFLEQTIVEEGGFFKKTEMLL